MWRLIVVTFAFMAWGFYQLSGGADYRPSEGSRQHAALFAAPAPAPARTTAPAKPHTLAGSQVVLASATPQPAAPKPGGPVSDAEKRLRLTLNTDGVTALPDQAKTEQTSHGVATVAADPDKIARLVAAAGAVRAERAKPAVTDTQSSASSDGRDIRRVQPARVNMRQGPGTDFSVVAKLTQGTEVEVLSDEGDGWVKLRVVDTGRVGWMADYLLVAGN